ncbi:MAG: DNA modification methylase [Chloroflexota bacterium]|nr:DNA modification methylase [Chloroflexota bacterium]
MNVVEMPLADLVPAAYNPRKALRDGDPEYAKLRRSIEEFGLVDPIIWNSRTKRVIGGHQRLTVLRDLGRTTVPTVVVDLDEKREKALNVALNKVTGDWDLTLLRDLLNEIQLSGEDATLTGFDPKEIEELVTSYRDSDPGEDAPVPEPPKDPLSRPGDLYELGSHRLLCGDSREVASWERLLGREVADIMWTDPPYGVDLQIRVDRMNPDKGAVTNGEDAFEGDKPEETRPLLAAVFRQADTHLKRGAPIYIAAPHGRMLTVFQEEYLRTGWLLHQTLVWVKNSFVPGRTDYHYQHEAVIYGWKRGAPRTWALRADQSTVIDDTPSVAHMKREELLAYVKELRAQLRTDVLYESKTPHNDVHPTMKPVPLVRRMLANSSVPNAIVLEPFGGSGTTLIAAAQMGRRARAIELEPRFCDVIVQRWQNLTGQKARRITAAEAAA